MVAVLLLTACYAPAAQQVVMDIQKMACDLCPLVRSLSKLSLQAPPRKNRACIECKVRSKPTPQKTSQYARQEH